MTDFHADLAAWQSDRRDVLDSTDDPVRMRALISRATSLLAYAAERLSPVDTAAAADPARVPRLPVAYVVPQAWDPGLGNLGLMADDLVTACEPPSAFAFAYSVRDEAVLLYVHRDAVRRDGDRLQVTAPGTDDVGLPDLVAAFRQMVEGMLDDDGDEPITARAPREPDLHLYDLLLSELTDEWATFGGSGTDPGPIRIPVDQWQDQMERATLVRIVVP